MTEKILAILFVFIKGLMSWGGYGGIVILMIGITNFFNRINTTFRVPAWTRWD